MDIKFIEEYKKELEKKSKKDLIKLVIANEMSLILVGNIIKTTEEEKQNLAQSFFNLYNLYTGKDIEDFENKYKKYKKDNELDFEFDE